MGEILDLRAPGSERNDRSEVEPLLRELIGASLRAARHRAGLRLVDVADRAGVSPQHLSEVERGLKDPSSEVLAAITGALQLRVVELVSRITDGVADGVAGVGSQMPGGPVCLAA